MLSFCFFFLFILNSYRPRVFQVSSYVEDGTWSQYDDYCIILIQLSKISCIIPLIDCTTQVYRGTYPFYQVFGTNIENAYSLSLFSLQPPSTHGPMRCNTATRSPFHRLSLERQTIFLLFLFSRNCITVCTKISSNRNLFSLLHYLLAVPNSVAMVHIQFGTFYKSPFMKSSET